MKMKNIAAVAMAGCMAACMNGKHNKTLTPIARKLRKDMTILRRGANVSIRLYKIIEKR